MRYLIILGVLALSACSQTRVTEHQIVLIEPPAVMLECAESPAMPDVPYTQRDVANLVVDLYAAGEDCRNSLGAVRSYVTEQRKLILEN